MSLDLFYEMVMVSLLLLLVFDFRRASALVNDMREKDEPGPSLHSAHLVEAPAVRMEGWRGDRVGG